MDGLDENCVTLIIFQVSDTRVAASVAAYLCISHLS